MLAQAIGRWGNYFNQELYGRPTTLPWALHIDPAHRPVDTPTIGLYTPRSSRVGVGHRRHGAAAVGGPALHGPRGRLFALYVAAYTPGAS